METVRAHLQCVQGAGEVAKAAQGPALAMALAELEGFVESFWAGCSQSFVSALSGSRGSVFFCIELLPLSSYDLLGLWSL